MSSLKGKTYKEIYGAESEKKLMLRKFCEFIRIIEKDFLNNTQIQEVPLLL